MFAADKYNKRFRANSVRLEEIIQVDTMMAEGRLPALARLKDDFPFIHDALSRGGLCLFPGVHAASTVEELESCLTRLAQLDSLGFLVKARQARFTVMDGALCPSWA